MIDGEPWSVFGKIEDGERGQAVVTGSLDGKPFRREVPIQLAGAGERPVVAKLWAQERVRALTDAMRSVDGRRADRLKERIVALAVEHGISTPFTAFLVVETRTGDRKATGVPETRVVPVNLPAGWAMFDKLRSPRYRMPAAVPMGGRPLVAAMSMPPGARGGGPRAVMAKAGAFFGAGRARQDLEDSYGLGMAAAGAPAYPASFEPAQPEPPNPTRELLQRQLASGLWDDATPGDPLAQARATTEALLELLRAGVDTAHGLYGAQVKKAVAALARLAVTLAGRDHELAERALGVAWLAASGRRTRREVEDAVSNEPALAGLRSQFSDERGLRVRLGV
jgi:Ca-activated chloride channel family protein